MHFVLEHFFFVFRKLLVAVSCLNQPVQRRDEVRNPELSVPSKTVSEVERMLGCEV